MGSIARPAINRLSLAVGSISEILVMKGAYLIVMLHLKFLAVTYLHGNVHRGGRSILACPCCTVAAERRSSTARVTPLNRSVKLSIVILLGCSPHGF